MGNQEQPFSERREMHKPWVNPREIHRASWEADMIVQVPEFKALSRHGVVTMPALTIEGSAMSIAQLSHGLRHYGKTSARFICHHLALLIGYDESRPFRDAFESAMDNLGDSVVGTVDRLILRDLCDDDESASLDIYHLTQ